MLCFGRQTFIWLVCVFWYEYQNQKGDEKIESRAFAPIGSAWAWEECGKLSDLKIRTWAEDMGCAVRSGLSAEQRYHRITGADASEAEGPQMRRT